MPVRGIAALSVAALAVWVVLAVLAAWQVMVAALAVAAVLVVPVTLALRWSTKLAVVHWENAPQSRRRRAKSAKVHWEGSVLPWRQALPAPPLAIEAPRLAPAWDNGGSRDGRDEVAVRACAAGESGGVHPVP